jgi:hypothetical protein
MSSATGLMICLLALGLGADPATTVPLGPPKSPVGDGYLLAQARMPSGVGRGSGGLGATPPGLNVAPIGPLTPPTLNTPALPPSAVAPPPAVMVPPKRTCREHPCASRQAYKVRSCNSSTQQCREEWKFRCVAGTVCQ